MALTQIIGMAAAVLTSVATLPQLLKIIKTKHTKSISLETFLILFLGICLWLIYGILIKDMPLIFANIVSISINTPILYLKIKYK